MATKKLPDLVEIVSVESSDLLLVRDLTDATDKKCTVDVLLASRIGGDSGSTSNFVLIADGTGGKSLKAATNVVIDNDGQLSVGSDTANAMVDITCKDADTSALKLKSAASQEENIVLITDSADATLANITRGGKIQTNAGVKAIGNQWGDCFVGWRYQGGTPEHTISNNTGYYDWTGSSYGENLFYDTVNSPFTANDALNHNFIVVNSGDKQGAKAEIIHYIDASRVLICCCGQAWNSDLSGVNYSIVKAPEVIFGDGPASHIHVGMFGGFRVSSSEGVFYGEVVMGVDCRAGMAGRKSLSINQKANGYDRCDALEVNYISGDLQSGSMGHGIHININESEATAGHIDGIIINSTNVSSATKGGVHVGPGFTHAFSVTGSPILDPDYGYEITGSTVVDRVNSGGAGDDAFVNASVNQTLWDNDDDYVLIGSSSKFEVIESIFGTVSNKNLLFNFFYSKAGGGWTQFYPYDGTVGGTKSGLIYFPAPGDWTKDDQAVVNGDITEAYYIKIQRTYNFVVAVLPIEAYFKIYEEQIGETGMEIRGNGVVKLPYLTTYTPSENGDVWMESDGLHIYYNGVEKVVAGV